MFWSRGRDSMPSKKRSSPGVTVPQLYEFHWPIICALKEMGGSASIAELVDRVATDMQLSDDILAVPHGDGSQSEVQYRIAWARTFLKKVGAIDNSERGVWTLTKGSHRIGSNGCASAFCGRAD